jgi:TetR/AcrR family transcriptional regulator, cholesterol catabolism regulator
MTAATTQQPSPRLPIGGTSLQGRIAEAAIELFYSRGALSTTVREITSACGLTPGALYNHFSSKEQLLYVLVRDIHLLVEAELAAAISAADPEPTAQLAAAVRFMVWQTAGLRKQSLVANRELASLADERREEVNAIRRRVRSQFADILLAGIQAGAFTLPRGQDRLSAALTANAIGTLCANISEWTRDNYPEPLADLQDRYVEMALRLAGAVPPGPVPPRSVPPGR